MKTKYELDIVVELYNMQDRRSLKADTLNRNL